jgi:hypothetical protein
MEPLITKAMTLMTPKWICTVRTRARNDHKRGLAVIRVMQCYKNSEGLTQDGQRTADH